MSHSQVTLRRTTNSRFVAFLGTFARPAQQVWLPGNDLHDPSTLDAPPPPCPLKRLHEDLMQQYDCTYEQAAAQPVLQSVAGGAAAKTRRHKPAASARRLPGQRQLQTRSSAAQPPRQGAATSSSFALPS